MRFSKLPHFVYSVFRKEEDVTMIRKILVLPLLFAMAMSSEASQVLWASLAESSWSSVGYDSVVTDGKNTVTVAQFFGNDIADAMYRIVLPETGTFLEIYCGPDLGWQDGEFGLDAISSPDPETGAESGYLYGHTGAFNADGIDDETLVRMEIGLYVWNSDINDWDVEIMAHSEDVTFGSLVGAHTSNSPIPPPTFNDWMPRTFYTDYPIPEPSISILLMLGISVLSCKRKVP